MERPRRQAALLAMEKMQRVREWEELPENSKRFRECAAQIEAEFRAEEKKQEVRFEDLDDTEDGQESDDEYVSANESFVSEDSMSEASEYEPEPGAEEVSEDDISSEAATETESEPPPEESEEESDADSASRAETDAHETETDTSASTSNTLVADQAP
jgi:hypothetical protein